MRVVDRQELQKKLDTFEWKKWYIEDEKLIVELKNHEYNTELSSGDIDKCVQKIVKSNNELPIKVKRLIDNNLLLEDTKQYLKQLLENHVVKSKNSC